MLVDTQGPINSWIATPGGRIVCSEDCYHGTAKQLRDVLPKWGVSAEFAEKIAAVKTTGGRSGIGTTLAGNAMGWYGDHGDELVTEASDTPVQSRGSWLRYRAKTSPSSTRSSSG